MGRFLLQHPSAMALFPKDVVIANWHYRVRDSYDVYLQPFARAGLCQFVSPGDSNWGEIYPDITTAVKNTGRYVADGQRTSGVIGVLDTVWNDDGETLFNATWYPVLFGVVACWQSGFSQERRFHDRFAWAFFGDDAQRLVRDIDDLRSADSDTATTPSDSSDYQFWSDPFAVHIRIAAQIDNPRRESERCTSTRGCSSAARRTCTTRWRNTTRAACNWRR
ncbi:MAG: hypothetical protein GIW99_08790 [Candidatus Eremiobacteraeota bacterium]|nr:hypothetical protein [Candidatus Eremiobacteraeota bacterium]